MQRILEDDEVLERATSTRGRIIALVVVLVAGAAVSAASGGDELTPPLSDTDARLHALLRQAPSASTVVPGGVPDGYELWATPAWSTPGGDPGATWLYRASGSADSAPVVSVCVVPNAVPDTAASCAPDGGEPVLVDERDEVTVFVVPVGPDAEDLDHTAWEELDVREQRDAIQWLDG